ncbi:hypothetical protein [Sphingobium boeckii]|uniref:DUF304 domain-containing protein n=1 Tax=Sphingobium boeckii TaxID=1082345 RepID=A0A7W9AL49_9SPHN|nr:hypothetical protein [Sphingobium boeckii]MBB5687538.1 hypothetical protein [Sphingobium boeckii]
MMTPVMPPLSPALRQALDREMAAGERILWSAQPRANRLWGGFGIWLFAVPWTIFALVWESMALLPWMASSKTPDAVTWTFGIIMPLFGLPFIAVGIGMMLTPVRAMRRARNTVYALTSKRLMRLVEGRKASVSSVFTDRIGPIDRSENADGWGDLRIQTHSHVDSEGSRTTERFDMLGIPDVARLEKLIVDAQPR